MSLSMNGHLLRCRLRIRSSRTEQYAPVRVLAGALHLTIASRPVRNRLDWHSRPWRAQVPEQAQTLDYLDVCL